MRSLAERRNSLGFVVRPDSRRHTVNASIVWGKRDNGSRVFITEAERGSKQGLRCECGAVLVARQGAINAWHFAHKADELTYCSIAAAKALSEFASQTIAKHGIILPANGAFDWRPTEIRPQALAGGVLLRTERGMAKLDIFIFRRKTNVVRYVEAQKESGVSALAIVLGGVEHLDDPAIAAGLRETCSRSWIFNTKAWTPPREEEEDLAARWERLFPAEEERMRLHRKPWR